MFFVDRVEKRQREENRRREENERRVGFYERYVWNGKEEVRDVLS